MKKATFVDENENELVFYINSDNKIYLEVSNETNDIYTTQFICLDKEDVSIMITELETLLTKM
jgi:hypothetical protein